MLWPRRNNLNELLEAGLIEGPLTSEDAMGWISNMLIESKIVRYRKRSHEITKEGWQDIGRNME